MQEADRGIGVDEVRGVESGLVEVCYEGAVQGEVVIERVREGTVLETTSHEPFPGPYDPQLLFRRHEQRVLEFVLCSHLFAHLFDIAFTHRWGEPRRALVLLTSRRLVRVHPPGHVVSDGPHGVRSCRKGSCRVLRMGQLSLLLEEDVLLSPARECLASNYVRVSRLA